MSIKNPCDWSIRESKIAAGEAPKLAKPYRAWAKQAAEDFEYDPEVIKAVKKATSDREIVSLMSYARLNNGKLNPHPDVC